MLIKTIQTVVNSYIIQETTTVSYVLEETDGERILTEDTAQFVNGETIKGATSNATAKIVIEDSRNKRLYITSQQKFITGETFTGQTSGAQGSITQYRGNPIQNIQQLGSACKRCTSLPTLVGSRYQLLPRRCR